MKNTLLRTAILRIIGCSLFLVPCSLSSFGQVLSGNCYNGEGTMRDAAGTEKSGTWVDGKLRGPGKIVFANGDVDEGQFVDDKLDGLGSRKRGAYREEGSYANGTFLRGKKFLQSGIVLEGDYDGPNLVRGKITFSNGLVDEGEFKQGKLTGPGKRYSSFRNETGVFAEGKLVGEGRRELPGNRVEAGTFEAGLLVNGTIEYANGDRYAGPLKNGLREGDGEMYIAANRSTYTGGFVADKRQGAGRIIWSDGASLFATFEADQVVGDIQLTRADGTKYSGPVEKSGMNIVVK